MSRRARWFLDSAGVGGGGRGAWRWRICSSSKCSGCKVSAVFWKRKNIISKAYFQEKDYLITCAVYPEKWFLCPKNYQWTFWKGKVLLEIQVIMSSKRFNNLCWLKNRKHALLTKASQKSYKKQISSKHLTQVFFLFKFCCRSILSHTIFEMSVIFSIFFMLNVTNSGKKIILFSRATLNFKTQKPSCWKKAGEFIF